MLPTAETVASWAGREAVDADGHAVGTIAGQRWPEFLAVEREGGTGEVVLVPLAGAEPTGQVVRLAVPGDTVLRAPPVADPAEPTDDERARLAAHYARPAADRPAVQTPAPELDGSARAAIVARLREAHALEGEGIRRLGALSAAVSDAEVRHGATLHAGVSELHRAGVERRLAALGERPARLRDAVRSVAAKRAGHAGSRVAALRDAEAFERREAAFYAQLEALARRAGDVATADLAAAHRADELAVADAMAGAIPRLDSPA